MKNFNSIVWLRRDLRLHDHTSFSSAIEKSSKILPIFVFDQEILVRFNNKNDRRLSFIAETLFFLNKKLKEFKGEILILYGKGSEIIEKTAKILQINEVFAAEDYEPETTERDQKIANRLTEEGIDFTLEEDNMLISVLSILKKDRTAYKIFSAYKKIWKTRISESDYCDRNVDFTNTSFIEIEHIKTKLTENDIKIVNSSSVEEILKNIGYNYVEIPAYWQIDKAQSRLKYFTTKKLADYKIIRDYMGENGTSMLSPYIRFGLISIRECYRAVEKIASNQDWINELIWRDFYKMILYYFSYSSKSEFKKIYKNNIEWENDETKFAAWCNGKTGFPLIDAAMKQLVNIGWMHNRMRMVTASFLTKHLLIDWRKGEEYFAQYLMDYDLSSNVGGWQWSASTGNDAQPYFRIFNPSAQAKSYDAEAKYIKKFLPELKNISVKKILEPRKYDKLLSYPEPIVEHKAARIKAIKIFKKAKSH